jgi:tRNA (cmo5U34)-methyltransferase
MMEDPIQRHPTRAEQLDIMVSILASLARPGDRVLDLGCGTGYFQFLLAAARDDLEVTGVDLKPESLAAARERLGETRYRWVEGDLSALDALPLPHERYRFVVTGLTFHDLSDSAKAAVIRRVASLLEDDGVFLLYDRVRLIEPALFEVQKAIWDRIERVHGVAMRGAPSFEAYVADLDKTNTVASLDDYATWFEAAGLARTIVHLHGNIAIQAGAKGR